jgi:hypothetical protein
VVVKTIAMLSVAADLGHRGTVTAPQAGDTFDLNLSNRVGLLCRFDQEFLDYLGRKTKVLSTLRDTNVLDDKTVEDLEKAIVSFKQEFQTGEGKPLASVGREEFSALPEKDVHQEKIVKKKR